MQSDKSGRFMFNLKFGPAIGMRNIVTSSNTPSVRGDDFFALVLDFGVALDAAKNAYLLFPLQFQLHDTSTCQNIFPPRPCTPAAQPWQVVMVPIGFQYDIPIRAVPGLYLTPRLIAGYAAFVPDVGDTVHSGFVAPEFGVKLIIKRRVNIGFDPFSLPIFFTPKFPVAGQTFVTLEYRLLWYAGVNF
jgi:hypothetical protein